MEKDLKKIGFVMIVIAIILLSPMYAHALAVNYFHGTSYDDSKESVAEYEQILRDQGYVCVTQGHSDNQEWTDKLLADDWIKGSAGAYLTDTGDDFRMYVNSFDYKQWEKGEIDVPHFLSLCYAVDYYIFNHPDELGSGEEGLIGDAAIEAGYPCGYLTIYLNVDDDLKAQPNIVYNIILRGRDDGKFYDLSSNKFANNNYWWTYKIPAMKYEVYSVIADKYHVADWSENEKEGNVSIAESTNRDLYITFNRVEGDPDILSGSDVKSFNPDVEYDGDTIIVHSDNTKIQRRAADEGPKEKTVTQKFGALFLLGGILIVGGIAVLIVSKRMKERNGDIG